MSKGYNGEVGVSWTRLSLRGSVTEDKEQVISVIHVTRNRPPPWLYLTEEPVFVSNSNPLANLGLRNGSITIQQASYQLCFDIWKCEGSLHNYLPSSTFWSFMGISFPKTHLKFQTIMNRVWGPSVTVVILLSCSLHRGPLLGVRKEKLDRPQSSQCWYSPEPPLEEANEKIKFTEIAMVVPDCNQSPQEAESGGKVQVHDQLDLYNQARQGNKTRPYLKNQIISKCMKFQKVFQRLCNIKVKKWITDMLKKRTTTKFCSRKSIL